MSDVLDTTCDGCIACVTFFLHETCLLLVSLFYGKCYVTIFIREYVAFSYRYWGKFLPKQNEKKLSRIMFFHRKRRFLFFFPSFLESIFFWAFLSATFYIFFGSSMTWRILLVLRFTFFFIVMKRHNRFFWIGDFCFIPAGHSQTMGWLHKLHELPS
jgi:hypothetical protein